MITWWLLRYDSNSNSSSEVDCGNGDNAGIGGISDVGSINAVLNCFASSPIYHLLNTIQYHCFFLYSLAIDMTIYICINMTIYMAIYMTD